MALPNQYIIIDDYAATAGVAAGSTSAAASGQLLFGPFTAPSASAAITVAHLVASIRQAPVRVVNPYGGIPAAGTTAIAPTLVQGAPANVALTAVPSGILF